MIIFFQLLPIRKIFVLGCFMIMLGSAHINIAGRLEQRAEELKKEKEKLKNLLKDERSKFENKMNQLSSSFADIPILTHSLVKEATNNEIQKNISLIRTSMENIKNDRNAYAKYTQELKEKIDNLNSTFRVSNLEEKIKGSYTIFTYKLQCYLIPLAKQCKRLLDSLHKIQQLSFQNHSDIDSTLAITYQRIQKTEVEKRLKIILEQYSIDINRKSFPIQFSSGKNNQQKYINEFNKVNSKWKKLDNIITTQLNLFEEVNSFLLKDKKIKDKLQEYRKKATELQTTIDSLPVDKSLISYVKNAKKYSTTVTKKHENDIEESLNSIAESINKIKKGIQKDISQYLAQINKIEDLKSEKLKERIKKDLLILKKRKSYLELVQKEFQGGVSALQAERKNVLDNMLSRKESEYSEELWEQESLYMMRLFKRYGKYILKYEKITFLESKGFNSYESIKNEMLTGFDKNTNIIDNMKRAFQSLNKKLRNSQKPKKILEKSTNLKNLIKTSKKEYGTEKSNLEKILEQLTIQGKILKQIQDVFSLLQSSESKSPITLVNKINEEIKYIKKIVEEHGFKEKDYLIFKDYLIEYYIMQVKEKIENIRKMNNYLTRLQSPFKEALDSTLTKFSQLSNVKKTKEARGTELVALLTQYYEALAHIKLKSYDGSSLNLLNEGYTTKANEIIQKIKTIEENTNNKIKQIKNAVNSNTTSSLKPKQVNSNLNNNSSEINEKVKLKKLLENTQKKYESKINELNNSFIQVKILNNASLKHLTTYKEISNALNLIKKSNQKITKGYKAYLKDSQKLKEEIDKMSSKLTLRERIQNPYMIFENRFNNYLNPLGKECKKLLDSVEKIELLKANNQSNLDPTLTNTWERIKGLEVRKIVEKVLLLYSQDLDTDANFFVLTDSKQYKDAFNSVQKKCNTIGNTIKSKLNSFQVLGNSLSGIDKKIKEKQQEYSKKITQLQVTINSLPVNQSLIDYTQKAAQYYSSPSTKEYEQSIHQSLGTIQASILEIKPNIQQDLPYTQYFNQINRIEDWKPKEFEKRISEELASLDNQNSGYLQPIQKEFQKGVNLLTKERNKLLNVLPLKEDGNWMKKVWENESKQIDNLLKVYANLINKTISLEFKKPEESLLNSYINQVTGELGGIPRLQSVQKGIREIYPYFSNILKFYKEVKNCMEGYNINYQKAKEKVEQTLNKLTVQEKILQGSNSPITLAVKVNQEIENIKKIIEANRCKYSSYLELAIQWEMLKSTHVKKINNTIENINKMNDYLACLQSAFKEALNSILSTFDQLFKGKNTKEVKEARDTQLVALLSVYHQALAHIKTGSYDGRSLYLLNKGYTTKKNEIIKKIKTIKENTNNQIKEIKKAVNSNTPSSLKPKQVNSNFNNNSSEIRFNINDEESNLKNEKVKLRKLLANTQKKYKGEMENVGEYPFQELILDHPILKNATTHNEISEALNSIKKSAQKIKKDYEQYLEYDQSKINDLSSNLFISNLREEISDPYTIFNYTINDYLKPLVTQCKAMLDSLQEFQKLQLSNQTDPRLHATFEKIQKVEVEKALETLLECYKKQVDIDNSLALIIDPVKRDSYMSAFNESSNELSKISKAIALKLESLKELLKRLSSIDQKIKEKQQEYSKKITQLQVTINSLPVNQSLIDYTQKAAQYYSSPSTKEYEQSIHQSLGTIQTSILEIRAKIQQDLPYTQYLDQINRIEDWKPEEFEKRMNEELASLDNQNTRYLQPIQKEFQKMVNLLATERKKGLEVLPSEKHNHWMKKVWKKESELISQLLEIYADLIKKTVSLEFKKPEESLVNSYIDEIKADFGGFAALQDLQSGIKYIFSLSNDSFIDDSNDTTVTLLPDDHDDIVNHDINTNQNQNGTQQTSDNLSNNGTTVTLLPDDNQSTNNSTQTIKPNDDITDNSLNDSISNSTQTTKPNATLDNKNPKTIPDPDKNNKLPLIVLAIVVILGLGGLFIYLLVGKKKILMNSSPKEVSKKIL